MNVVQTTRALDGQAERIASASVSVDCGAWRTPLCRIWTSFGYDEINWTHTPRGKRALRVIGGFAEQPYFVRTHYVFKSGIGWPLPHWGAGNVYHERGWHAVLRLQHCRPGLRRNSARGASAVSRTRVHATALVPDDTEQHFAHTPGPTQWCTYEAGLWSFPPEATRNGPGWCRPSFGTA